MLSVKLWRFGSLLPVQALRGRHPWLDLGFPCREGFLQKESEQEIKISMSSLMMSISLGTYWGAWRKRWTVLDSVQREINFYEYEDPEEGNTHTEPTETIQLVCISLTK